MSTKRTQQAYLRAAKDRLGLDWDTLAVRAGIAPRALKNYLLPDASSGHRTLPALARAAIEELLVLTAVRKRAYSAARRRFREWSRQGGREMQQGPREGPLSLVAAAGCRR
jgi:hypothetical protein